MEVLYINIVQGNYENIIRQDMLHYLKLTIYHHNIYVKYLMLIL